MSRLRLSSVIPSFSLNPLRWIKIQVSEGQNEPDHSELCLNSHPKRQVKNHLHDIFFFLLATSFFDKKCHRPQDLILEVAYVSRIDLGS